MTYTRALRYDGEKLKVPDGQARLVRQSTLAVKGTDAAAARIRERASTMKSEILFLTLSLSIILGFDSRVWSAEERDFVATDVSEYQQHIRPFLTKHCVRCHGKKEQEADFFLHDIDGLVTDGTEIRYLITDLPKSANGQIVNEPLFLSGFAFFDERFPGGHGDAAVGELGR